MDILHLVDRLEEVFNAGRPVPFTRLLTVNEDRVLELIDQMRVSIPEEVKKAQQVLAQRDRILAQAQEEAQRTVQLAKEKAEQFVERDAVVEAAKARAEQILQNVKAEADGIRQDADDYALEVLTNIEVELARFHTQVHNGITKLRAEKGQPVSPASGD
jgi:cell division septum initiation protein DivIVA